MRFKALALTVALAVAAAVPAAALPLDLAPQDAEPAVEAAGTGSDNVSHVKQLTYAGVDGGAANRGTDLEFADIDVTDLDSAPEGVTGIRTFSFAGSYHNGLQIVDVTDPENAEIVAVYDCGLQQGDVQVFERDGRHYATFTHDTGYSAKTSTTCFAEAAALGFSNARRAFGTFIADVTDPYNPTTVSFVYVPKGSHNQTVHPSGLYLYNSNSTLITSAGSQSIEVFDISDFTAPQQVANLELPLRPGLGTESHDLTFNTEGTRAYSAALSQTVIINTEDPADPSVISSFMDPAINVEHQSNPITIDDPLLGERDFLIVEDELAGAAGAEPACPSGGVHVYDITGDLERAPVKVGYWNIDDVRPTTNPLDSCTAHVFQLFEEEAIMLIAYYNGGVRVVDLSGLVGVALGENGVGMKELGFYRFPDSNTWAVKAPHVDRENGFYFYGNDMNRGMDVYHFAGSASGAEESRATGTWLSPAEALALAQARPKVALSEQSAPYCLLAG
jgi:hypothetical protein